MENGITLPPERRNAYGLELLSKGLMFPILGAIPILSSELLLLYRVLSWNHFHLSEFILYLILNCFLFSIFGLISFVGWMTGLRGMVIKNKQERRVSGTLGLLIWSFIPAFAFILLAAFGVMYFFLDLSRSYQMLVYAMFTTCVLLFCGLSLGLHVRGRKAAALFVGALVFLAIAGEASIVISHIGPFHDYFYFVETTIVQISGMLLAIPLMVLAFRLTPRKD